MSACKQSAAWCLGASMLCVLASSCGSPIVGAECRDGYIRCDGVCVNPERNPQHCGGCDQSCGVFTCEAQECTTELQPDAGLDGSVTDSGQDDSGQSDGGRDTGIPDIGTGLPFLPDGGFMFPDIDVGMSCPIGKIVCNSVCVDPDTNAAHCGGCDMPCAGDQFCVLGVCDDRCDAPLELCDDLCVDFQNDPANCGGCGVSCASGICEDGACADATAGHVVVIGHDYRSGASRQMAFIAANALNLLQRSPVRAIAYRGGAAAASVNGVMSALDQAVALGRSELEGFQVTEVSADVLPARLLDVRVLILHAQDTATDAQLNDLGVTWGLALAQFVARGGVIVLFETQSTRNAGTFQILEPSGLFSADSRNSIGAPELKVVAPGDSVAGTTSRYSSTRTTVRFVGVESEGQVVVTGPSGDPVVLHRVVAP